MTNESADKEGILLEYSVRKEFSPCTGRRAVASFELFRTGTLNAIQPVEEPDARGDGHIENHPSEFNLPLLNLTAA